MIYSRKEIICEDEMGNIIDVAEEGQIIFIQYINGYRTKAIITEISDTGIVVEDINEEETLIVDYDEIYKFEVVEK